MARNALAITCDPEARQELERLAGSRTESKQMVERAQIILGCLAGKRVKEVARTCHTRPNTVIKWRQRFVQHGLAGLQDATRPGAKPVYGEEFRNRVLVYSFELFCGEICGLRGGATGLMSELAGWRGSALGWCERGGQER